MLQRLIGVTIGAIVTFFILWLSTVAAGEVALLGRYAAPAVTGAIGSFPRPVVAGVWLGRGARVRRDAAIQRFVVAADARGRGVATALLAAAVEHTRAAGAPAVEGYPIDVAAGAEGRVRDTGAYVGTRSIFERAGFRLAAPTTSHSGGVPRVVMRLDLA